MSTFVEIVSVLQNLNLKSGLTVNSLVLRHRDGTQFLVTIEGGILQNLLEKMSISDDVPSTPEQSASTQSAEDLLQVSTSVSFGVPSSDISDDPKVEPDQVAVFGGDVQAETSKPTNGQAQAKAPGPKPRPRKQKPAMNEMGYPIMPAMEGRDPGEIVGRGPNPDEDGVPSI